MTPTRAHQTSVLRLQLTRFPRRDPVELRVFRELMQRASPNAWLAMARDPTTTDATHTTTLATTPAHYAL